MSVEIAEHGITAPAAHNTDIVGINTREEKGHGTAGTEGSCCNVGRVDASMPRDGDSSGTEETSDHGAGDTASFAEISVVDVQRSCDGSTMGDEMGYPSKHSADGAGM